MKLRSCLTAASTILAGACLCALPAPSYAASHRDAPGQLSDPDANLTDVYAFVSANNTVTLSFNTHPFIDPAEGPLWTNFSPDVLYEVHVVNAPKATNGAPDFTNGPEVTYQFRFSPPAYQNTNTFLTEGRGVGLDAGPINTVGDPHQNLIQTYTVTRVDSRFGDNAVTNRSILSAGHVMIVPPPNVGARATPLYNDANGMVLQGVVDPYTQQSTYDLGGGRKVFAGMRDDGFFFDEGGGFDLLNLRKPGIDAFAGLNVMNITLQVPISDLVTAGNTPLIGVYCTSSRRQVTVRNGSNPTFSAGTFQVVSRMGNPLFNEVFVALAKKDLYNQTQPTNDEQFRTFAENPELAILANAVLLSSPNPATGPIPTSGRTDLSSIFIPDLLKLDTSTPAVPLAGSATFSRLGVFGGDSVKNAAGQTVSSGWPNGRRYGDDVIDIALTALASPNAATGGTITPVFDNVDSNDVAYLQEFPYLGPPHSGLNHKHHGQPEPSTPPATP